MENKAPLSPHIQIYKWHISSLVSISHRITGIINIIVITFVCLLVSPRIRIEASRQINVTAIIFIIPVILCDIDTNDEICHL